MLFNSVHYLLFLPLVFILYYAISHKYRWAFLLACSYYFYMCWRLEYIVLIIASTLVDYFVSLKIHDSSSKKVKKRFLFLSLAVNLGLLFGFKYLSFFNESIRTAFDSMNMMYDVKAFEILLPVGISFYTFQTISYTVDVYRGNTKPERHLGKFALFVSFFPQLVAGPIERSSHLLPQFSIPKKFIQKNVTEGFQLILWGMIKKIVIADRLAEYVNEVYNNPGTYEGAPVILATYFFAFQIYCDFSGYTDIARGSAKVLGFDIMENFRQPYFARSISEFWGRWHISLSTWFRDYVYIPLGGNRVGKWKWYYNLLITFLISGFWHGANWTFVLWGLIHGGFMVFSEVIGWKSKESDGVMKRLVLGLITFHIVVFAWVFFRANNVHDVYVIFKSMTHIHGLGINILGNSNEIIFAIIGISSVLGMHYLIEKNGSINQVINTRPRWQRMVIYHCGILILLFLSKNLNSEFIYFQF